MMEIPLRLIARKDGSLVYGVPVWFRLVMASMCAVVAVALLLGGVASSVLAWIVLGLLVLGVLYTETWVFDAARGSIQGTVGFFPLIKKHEIPFSSIEAIMLEPYARGTVPGGREEAESRRDALTEMRSGAENRSSHYEGLKRKKLFIAMIIETHKGERYLIDLVPARQAHRLDQTARALAAYAGCTFRQAES
ncbi:MAG: hypothetical protein WHT81_05480 [Rectinemataceae bacterium]|nr:hypothetical protein [Spirochaetaceae bacterium]